MRRILLSLVVVVLLVAGVVVLLKKEEQAARTERAEARLLQFDDRDLDAIELAFDGQPWRLERTERGWRVVQPIRDAASVRTLQDFLAACRRTPVRRVIEDPEALADYGLDPPVVSVSWFGVDAPRFALGESTPTGDGVFAQVEGRLGVLVLPLSELGMMFADLGPTDFRDSRLVDTPQPEIDKIELGSGAARLELTRQADGWWITQPRRLPADDGRVQGLLQTLDRGKVVRYLDDSSTTDPQLGLGGDARRVTLHGADRTSQLVLGVGHDGGHYATRNDRHGVLAMEPFDLTPLDYTLDDFVTTELARVNRYEVTRFAYRLGRRGLEGRREGERWSVDAGGTLEETRVMDLLATIFALPVSAWREAGPRAGRTIGELQFDLEDGTAGAIAFLHGGRARLSWLPDVVWELAAQPPQVPEPAQPSSD